MGTVIYGMDVYGAVRKVDSNPVVTRFAMLQLLPIFPRESYYLGALGATTSKGIPLIHQRSTTAFTGLPLARIDALSVAIAYVRALVGVVLVCGFIGFMFGIFLRDVSGGIPKATLLTCSGLMFAVAAIGGAATYAFTFSVPEREKRIRHICGEALGIAADPAELRPDTAAELNEIVKRQLKELRIDPRKVLQSSASLPPGSGPWLLLLARTEIALGHNQDRMEQVTDQLLDLIDE